MISKSALNVLLTSVAVIALTFCLAADAQAQRGFRIGNVLQAGGGQGFRLGGPRLGMHFGGGQGTSIGGQNFGMRFGNGQGARFGGPNYGMQFGGRQGTQIGRLYTTPSVTPGTYYYGDVQNRGYARPVVVQARPVMIPATVVSPNDGVDQANFAAPTLAGPAPTAPAEATEIQVPNPTSQLPPEGNSVLDSPTATTKTEEPVIVDDASPPAPTEQAKTVPETVVEAPIGE